MCNDCNAVCRPLDISVTALADVQAEYAGSHFTALPYFFNWRPYCGSHIIFSSCHLFCRHDLETI